MISFFLPKGLGCYAEKPKILCCAKTEGGSNMKNNSIYLVVILTSTILAYAALEDQPGDTIKILPVVYQKSIKLGNLILIQEQTLCGIFFLTNLQPQFLVPMILTNGLPGTKNSSAVHFL
jgi:hypothetical protein